MENKKELIIETFNNSFNLQRFVDFTQELFKGNAKYKNSLEFSPKIKGEFNTVVKEFLELGLYKDKNRKSMVIAVVRLEREDSVARSRAIQRNFVKDYFLKTGSDSALVAFYNKNSGDWRLSFIKLDYSYNEVKIEEIITPAKRFSFLLGANEKHHTAIERFLPLINNDLELPTIKEIEEIFNIEVVTKEFFEIYCQLYLNIKKDLDKQEGFNEMARQLDFKSDEFGKKIMGQLVFLYFLQKKGWLGVEANPKEINVEEANKLLENKGYDSVDVFEKTYELKNGKYIRNDIIINKFSDEETTSLNSIFINTKYDGNWGSGDKNFIRSLYNRAIKEEKNFYKDYLEHVFYNALNDKRGGSVYFKELNCKIPFLNGGLFQPINEKYNYQKSEFIIPNEIFSNKLKTKQGDIGDGILDIFDRYAFTVKEDEPLEKEVAVDPEMLGKVFENLLDVVDRKKKGAFYTPRDIVHYMCQESLINYLITEVGIEYKDAEILIRYGDVLADIDSSKKASETGNFKMPLEVRRNAKRIDLAFLNVKIADPAVGSGAFPLGMLHEIVRARMNLTQYMIDDIAAIHSGYINIKGRKPYDLKLQTIQRCIHAVDIERSAVDIAKLRLWLSLVVEENDFKNVKPLPNLDYNIMVGNSLLDEFEGVKLFNEKLLEEKKDNLVTETTVEQIGLFNGKKESEYLLDDIYDLQEKFFSANSKDEKIKLKEEIDNLEWTLIEKTVRENGREELLLKIKEFKRTNTKPYFLWRLNFAKVFREKGGFDIVIGNPPYIRVQNINKDEIYSLRSNFESATGKFDLYVIFVEKAFNLIRQSGVISYIHPNRFLNSDYGVGLRKFLLNIEGIKQIIDFNISQIFETATTYTGIFMYSKNNSFIKFANSVVDDLYKLCFTQINYEDLGNKWNFSERNEFDLINKIKNQEYKMTDVFDGIYQGIVTGGDNIYILKGKILGDFFYGYSDELGQEVKLEAKIMKPILDGVSIKRYFLPTTDMYIIYPHYINKQNNKTKTKPFEEDVLKETFPLAYNYLLNFQENLVEKKVKYKTNVKYWYSLHRARELSLFEQMKIITPQMQNCPHFTIDTNGEFLVKDAGYSLIKKYNIKEDYRYFMAILNSHVLWYFIANTSPSFGGEYYSFKTKYLEDFSLPITTDESIKLTLIKNVEKILALKCSDDECVVCDKQEKVSMYEREINSIIYNLYNLTKEEINLIESSITEK